MSYLPSGLAELATAFAAEEEDVLRVHMDPRGTSSDIALLHRYVSDHASQTDFGMDGYSRQQTPNRKARPMPPNPNNQNPSSEPSSSLVDSPFFRRVGDFRRSSADQLLAGFSNTSIGGGLRNNNNENNSTNPPDLDDPDVEPVVKQSSSSESQALYGNENVVKELKPDYVRWFYKYEQDRTWTPFTGYDSIRMELRHRNLVLEREEAQLQEYCNTNNATTMNGYDDYYNNEYQYQQYTSTSSTTITNNATDDPSSTARFTNFSRLTTTSILTGQGSSSGGGGGSGSNSTSPNRLTNIMSKTWNRAWNPAQKASDSTNGEYSYNNGQQQPINNSSPNPNEMNNDSNLDDCSENVIIVRGGLYEADLDSWTCVATYWPGDKCQITRGTWFYDGTWQPLSVDHAEKLEEEHLGQFAGVSLTIYANNTNQPESPTKKNKPVVHRVSFCEFHVDWTSPTDIHLFSKAASYKFMRSVGQRLGFQTWGHRLCRGYFKPASLIDRPSEISHLVFVVHGIGQKMDTGRIVRNCASFRETVSSLKEKFFPHLNETKQRAEFFPVEWRSAAKLDGDVVDAITPHKLLSLRQLLNATAMDIMYYTSPLYRTEIQNALRNELNRIYSNFVKRNPDFRSRGGKVSVIAHSLGAVITYDIITGYMPQLSGPEPPPPYGPYNHLYPAALNGCTSDHQQSCTSLLFQLEHFFCLGSPLSVFLALRWREPHNPDFRSFILPELLCKRIYNVFYSTDPVAYRLEPLLNKHYVHIAPLPVHSYGSLGRPKYDEMPRERINKEINYYKAENNSSAFSSQQPEPTTSAKTTPQRAYALKSPPTPTKESNWGWATIMKYLKSSENATGVVIPDGEIGGELISPDGNSSPGREDGNSTPEDMANELPNDLEYRMDYVLKESNFSSTYLAALTSHTSYWSSPDTAFFVLMHLYGGLLDCPLPPPAQ